MTVNGLVHCPPLLEYLLLPAANGHHRPEGCAMLLMHRWNAAYHVAAGLSALVFAAAVVAPGCGGRSSVVGPSSNPTSPVVDPSSDPTSPVVGRNPDPAACRFGVAPGTQAVAYSGVSGSIAVTTTSGCTWTATTDVGWITLTPPTGGSGSGTVNFVVAYNSETVIEPSGIVIPSNQRTGSVTIAGERSTILQAGSGPSCVLAIDPSSQTIGAAGGAGTPIGVSTIGCGRWTATSNAPWITVVGATGGGNGVVSSFVEANKGAERIGTITIAGLTATISQTSVDAPAPPPPPSSACWSTIDPTENGFDGFGTSGNLVYVTTPSTCTWTAISNDPWITITDGARGTGNGIVKYTVAWNAGAPRRGTLTIAGQTAIVLQGDIRFGRH
jgi:hypothetical protein